MDVKLIKHAKGYIEKLANGVNPLTNELVKEDDIINNVRISRCLFYVNEVLEKVLNDSIQNKKLPFNINEQALTNYQYSEEPLSISKIVRKINNLKTDTNMEKLKVNDICNWLINIGLLMEGTLYDKKVKRPTEKGKILGMYTEHRIGSYGEYDIILYKQNAEKFIIKNLDDLIDYINNK